MDCVEREELGDALVSWIHSTWVVSVGFKAPWSSHFGLLYHISDVLTQRVHLHSWLSIWHRLFGLILVETDVRCPSRSPKIINVPNTNSSYPAQLKIRDRKG